MKKTFIRIIPLILLILYAGCMPLTHMDSAPTQKPGRVELEGGLNMLASGDGSGSATHFTGRVGLAPRLDFGLTMDSLSQNVDFKVHIITDEMAGFDLSASLGAGASVFMVYKFWNLIISKEYDSFIPYFCYRHTFIDDDKSDPGEEEDGLGGVMLDILQGGIEYFDQFFVGLEYKISERTFFVVEGMFLTRESESGLFFINAGYKFKF